MTRERELDTYLAADDGSNRPKSGPSRPAEPLTGGDAGADPRDAENARTDIAWDRGYAAGTQDAEAERDRARNLAASLEAECARLTHDARRVVDSTNGDLHRNIANLRAALTGPTETGDPR